MKEKNQIKLEKVLNKDIAEEMKESFVDYAMSVIVSRALPDVRDGLKPVQRRILYSMYEMGLKHDGKFRKSATVVGHTMGAYHPHGDAPVYEALVRMAQDFSMRYPLVLGQGNFGSIDGDPPASMRYTECKLSRIGEEMLKDIEKDTVDFSPNYDGTRKEPTVLPSPLPQLILNGALGIAVGMATSIPPHNLGEVCDALIYLIDHPKATTEELFKFIQGPDFPTGGIVFDKKGLIEVYSKGRGPIYVRGRAEIVEDEKKRAKIIITEIPYQVQKSLFLENLAKLVSEKKIEGIRDIRDESDREGMRIVIELQKGVLPQRILNALYKYTELQKVFHLNLVALVDGIQPQTLNLVEVLSYFLEHRRNVVLRRTKYDLEKAKERVHILEGIQKCLLKIEKVVKIIKASKDRERARESLMKEFSLDKVQAEAILEMKLGTLAKLEREKIERELKEIEKKIEELKEILASRKKVNETIKKELLWLKETFGDKRKTTVVEQKIDQIPEEELIPAEEVIITLTQGGYIKRSEPKEFKAQKRGGVGILGIKTVGEDVVNNFLVANTRDSLLFFTDSGKVFKMPVSEVPKAERHSPGRGIYNFLKISQKDKIRTLISLGKEDEKLGFKYLFFVTKNGLVKKTPLSLFKNVRQNGLLAIRLKRGDFLVSCKKTTGEDEIILATKDGKAIRFKEKEVRPMGREASGILGIKLAKDDEVVAMEVLRVKKANLVVVSENGFGKRIELESLKTQGRGGKGILISRVNQKTGKLSALLLVGQESDLILISKKGKVLKTKIASLPKLSRATQGVKIMKLDILDKVVSAISI